MLAATLATAVLVVNELMAANVGEAMSPAVNFDSWIELYNPGDKPVSLGGMYLSDDANTPFRCILRPFGAESTDMAEMARVDMPVCQPVNCERQSNGRIKMTTNTKNATIYYSIDGSEYKKYTSAIVQNAPCTLKTYSTAEGLMDSQVLTYDFDLYINKGTWKLVSVDSQQSGNEARLAFDNNNSTFWHTQWGTTEPVHPHTLVVDMASEYKVTAFTYLARQDGTQNGMVKAYEVYLSTDGKTWGQAVAKGEFKNTADLQVAKLATPTVGRYLKFVAKSEVNGRAWASAAEIGIQAEADVSGIVWQPLQEQPASHDVYDLQGRRVDPEAAVAGHNRRGIYITDGKKVVR